MPATPVHPGCPDRGGWRGVFSACPGPRRALPAPGFRSFEPAYLELEREGTLAERKKELWSIYEKCRLRPRECEVNRLAGPNDICKATDKLRVHSAGAHFGEEAPLVERYGSGTLFFSDRNLRCCFCQNWEIARPLTREDWKRAVRWAKDAGLTNLDL